MIAEALPPTRSDGTAFNSTHHPEDNSFPIIAVAVIGILATGFLLVSYYVFIIKCCLNWHRVDILRRFSAASRSRSSNSLAAETPAAASRGLDESAIRTIPIFSYKNDRSFCECAVCLSEFEEEEKLRYIPNCNHAFHIDCIDVWLQNNANCPLCRTGISAARAQPLSPLFGDPTLFHENFTGNDEDYVIIDLPGRHSVSMDQSLLGPETERSNSATLIHQPAALLPPLKAEQRMGFRKSKTKLVHIASKGDECIDIRTRDAKFDVQPIRRSFSMGSSGDHRLCLMVQEIIKQQSNHTNDVISPSSSEGCSTSKLRRSFFSFGSGRGSKASVLPIQSNSSSFDSIQISSVG